MSFAVSSLRSHAGGGTVVSTASEVPFLFSGLADTLEARGGQTLVSRPAAGDLLEAAGRTLAGVPLKRKLVGALPFDGHAPAHLVLADVTRRHRRFSAEPRVLPASVTTGTWRVTERPARREYQQAVQLALDRLSAPARDEGSAIRKVVLARLLEVESPYELDPVSIFARLTRGGTAEAFCVPLPAGAGGRPRTLVGASPELLIARKGPVVTSRPLAGSAARLADSSADREAAAALVRSGKDQREHRLVVEAVLDVLAPYCTQLHALEQPTLVATGRMWHLATPIEGALSRDVSSLELAAALHPTPAVCGTPRAEARTLITQLEPFDRGFFAGAVGWCDGSGDGRWMVTIRCAEIMERQARLFAGAGIVSDSDPAAEAAETGAKFRTLLDALGIDELGQVSDGAIER